MGVTGAEGQGRSPIVVGKEVVAFDNLVCLLYILDISAHYERSETPSIQTHLRHAVVAPAVLLSVLLLVVMSSFFLLFFLLALLDLFARIVFVAVFLFFSSPSCSFCYLLLSLSLLLLLFSCS